VETNNDLGGRPGKSGMRWVIIGLIAIATVINYLDRNAIAVMWPAISQEIGATKADYALLVTCFMAAYAVGQAVFGWLFDKIGTRKGFVVSFLCWSVSMGAMMFAGTTRVFAGFRAALGFSEAANWPGAAKANAEWFPSKERALAQGIFNAGASLGAIISAPLVAALYLLIGWRFTFVAIGVLGLIWLQPWLYFYRGGPDKHPWISADERKLIIEGRRPANANASATGYVPTMGQLLKHRQAWCVIAARFFLDPIWWLFVSWLPIYLAETFGFDIKHIGMFAWVPFVGAMCGSLFGGWLSGALIRAGKTVGTARKTAITLGGVIMLPALLASMQAGDPLTAVIEIAAILFGFQVAIGNIQTLPSDFFSGQTVGKLAGISGMAAVAGVLITTWLVPVLTKVSYTPIFAVAAAIVPLAVLSVWVLGRRIEPVVPAQATSPKGN
jgi:ACS family hexuronate transporter-like MFS transporter